MSKINTVESSIESFIEDNQLSCKNIDSKKLLNTFLSQMKEGLARKILSETSSLAMLDSHVVAQQPVQQNKDIIVLDAGGSFIRASVIHFDGDRQLQTSYFKKHAMPGTQGELSRDVFFAELYQILLPVIDKADEISFCFSYPCEISAYRDGKLLRWTKEIQVPEVEGLWIGECLNQTIVSEGHKAKKISLLNDTVATLLAGKLRLASKLNQAETQTNITAGPCVGLILGTGTNCAYQQVGKSVVNIESGAFNGYLGGKLDHSFDQTCSDPGNYLFEKKISGRYLGPLFLHALKAASKEELFSRSCSKSILACENFSSQQLSDLLSNKAILPYFETDQADQEKIKHLGEALISRAAKLTAINICAAAIQSLGENNKKESTETKVCINIDGSTYYELTGFRKQAEEFLAELMAEQKMDYQLRNTQDAPLVGTAIAGLSD